MATKFPHFLEHDHAVCFQCGGPLSNPRRSPYPAGTGEYVATCPKDGLHTFYDIKPWEPEDALDDCNYVGSRHHY